MSDAGNQSLKHQNISDTDIENIVRMLDEFAASGEGRMKIQVTDKIAPGEVRKLQHHGRCDVGSAWATGQAFDVIEDESVGCEKESPDNVIEL